MTCKTTGCIAFRSGAALGVLRAARSARFVVWCTPYAVWRDLLGYAQSHHPLPPAQPHSAHSALTLTPPPSTTTARHGADGARESHPPRNMVSKLSASRTFVIGSTRGPDGRGALKRGAGRSRRASVWRTRGRGIQGLQGGRLRAERAQVAGGDGGLPVRGARLDEPRRRVSVCEPLAYLTLLLGSRMALT